MAYTGANKSTSYFNVKNYSGNGNANHAITGVGFQPDFTWIKRTDSATNHHLHNAVRGATKVMYSNATSNESTDAQKLTSFDSDGFTVGTNGDANNGSGGFQSWNWKANGAGSSNSDGSITSTVSANQTAGFSIVNWTGTGAAATIGHGLNAVPKTIIVKKTDGGGTASWVVYNGDLTYSKYITLNGSAAAANSDATVWNNTAPTSSVFSVGSWGDVNGNGVNILAYVFADKTGYCKTGRYDGNGNNDGNFIYLGFKPTFFLVKRYDNTGGWVIKDGTNSGALLSAANTPNFCNPNETDHPHANATDQNNKASAFGMDFVSNGVKIRGGDGEINTNGGDYIYLAMGQTLVGTNNVPCNAR